MGHRFDDELWYKRLRTFGFTLIGLGLFIWEVTIRSGAERPTYVIGYFALMGLPLVLKLDRPKVPEEDDK